jgi:hypothetical protein
MIIVSQDKKKIINFDNLTQVYITHCEEDNTGYFIRFETVDSLYEDLGEYSTEDRAKEVLEEIIERYTNWNNLVYGQPTGECSPKYEMPKE